MVDFIAKKKYDDGRKTFDEVQLGIGFLNRQFSYLSGQATEEHVDNGKLKSSPTTSLVSMITFASGRTISYTYDEEERISLVVDSVNGTAESTVVTEYTYDALGQLTSETIDGVTTSFTYDSYGNILTKGSNTYTYGDSNWKDKLTAYNGTAITYDDGGNPLSYRGYTFAWEKGRQLKSAVGNNKTISYIYNASGIRTSKTVDCVKHEYVLNGTKVLRESYGTNVLDFLYDNSESVCGMIYNSTPYYFYKNLQGDIISITNSSGIVVAKYSYDAWGACTIDSDTSGVSIATINPFRYRGYYFDTETGLYYLQSRYYDPQVGRFINADDAGYVGMNGTIASYNLFTYCGNNPVSNSDFAGCCPESNGNNYVNDIIIRIPAWVVSTAIDTLLLVLYAAMMAGYITFSGTIYTFARSPYTKKLAVSLITKKVIPIFIRGFYNPILTLFRKAMWLIAGVTYKFAKGFGENYLVDLLKDALARELINFVTSILTWGGIIALMFDMLDGDWDGYITIKI